jgi:hypothetical protein
MPMGVLPSTSPPGASDYPLVSGEFPTTLPHTTYEIFGASEYVISTTAATRELKCVLSAPAGFTAQIQLVDLTAGGVVLLTLSTMNAAPTALSGAFVPTDGTARVYAVQVRVTGGVPVASDRAICYGAYMRVTP